MKKWSDMRDRRLDGYRAEQKPQSDYFAEVFDRWVRIYGPPVAFAPEYTYVSITRTDDYAKKLAATVSFDMKEVSDRILASIPHARTAEAFKSNVGSAGFMVVYIRGRRYGVIDKPAARRMQELLFCYAILGPQSVREEMEAGLGKIAV